MAYNAQVTVHDFLKLPWLQEVRDRRLASKNIRMQVLRLDLMHPLVSGNKWLKLQYRLDAYSKGSYKGILTAGGPWSNHLHASAAACSGAGIPMHALVKASPLSSNAMLHDLRTMGVNLIFANRQSFYAEKTWENYATENDLMWIPMGGHGDEGIRGVRDFLNALPLDYYDHIWCAMGTGTTVLGLATSRHRAGCIHGFDPGTGDAALALLPEMLQQTNNASRLEVHRGKYRIGKTPPQLIHFMQNWHRLHGWPLDVVYTGPMMQYLLETWLPAASISNARLLFLHTGGLQGNRSQPALDT